MNWTRLLTLAVVVAILYGANLGTAGAQQPDSKQKKGAAPPKAGAADQFVIRVYNVADLVMPAPHYPFRGTTVPTFATGSASNFWMPIPGAAPPVGGSGTGGLGGFGLNIIPDQAPLNSQLWYSPADVRTESRDRAVALAQVSEGAPVSQPGMRQAHIAPANAVMPRGHEASNSPRFDIVTLQDVIVTTVDPDSWNSVGGQGICERLGAMLVIRQTPAAHEKIAEFLIEVRRAGGSLRPVTINAAWLSLDAKDFADLIGGARATAAPGQPVNRSVFEQLASSSKAVQGQITCFDGQTVHIISGQSHTTTTELNPVVAAGAVAYDPRLTIYHTGAMLQVTPTIASGGKHAVLDMWSVLSRWRDLENPIEVQGQVGPSGSGGNDTGQAAAKLDRVNLLAQQFSTTLRVPVGQPVLVGGMTLDPDVANSPRLYLVVEATPGDEIK